MQQGAGGGGSGSQYHQHVVEEASPISSRPPTATAANFDDMLPVTGDEDLVGSGGNRWPRQETLALLQIRSDMDVAFRDATLKGPLWDDISRKLAEQGYTRSAKKCKEKFENVQKYYKRTKETRAGRQDGKSYKFFSQLEALHGTPNPTITTITTATAATTPTPILPSLQTHQTTPPNFPSYPPLSLPAFPPTVGISFSSNSSSSSSSGSDDDEMDDFETEPSNPSTSRRPRKRKRVSSKGGSGNTSGNGNNNDKMMEFFESLMKELMRKQEVIQQRFIDTIEKREKDRMIREEAWKTQEMLRINREHELMAQDRANAASRDAAVIGFLQKITGQVIQLPVPVAINSPTTTPTPPPPPPQPQPQPQQIAVTPTPTAVLSHNQSPNSEHTRQIVPVSSETFMAVPVQQVPPQDPSSAGGGSSSGIDPTSSRWPKVEVLALIKIRSGLEGRYQEAGPKGPLWEEVSSGMQRMGYMRNPKRCKEKWENINKYFKKVKESNKTRPDDAKTCPYFHELDALYRRKILGGGSGGDGSTGSSLGNQNMGAQQQSIVIHSQEQEMRNMPAPQTTLITAESETKKTDGTSTNVQLNTRGFPGTLFEQGSISVKNGGHKKPEDTMKELIEQPQNQRQQQLMTNDYDKTMDPEEDEFYTDDDEEESEDEMKMDYKIEFQQKQNGAAPSNRGGNGASSFTAMVQ